MDGGLFITLYDEKTLALYLKYGTYGFLMKPVLEKQPSSRSMHYAALADYACARRGTHVFFFLKRKIVYAGTVEGNQDIASFYLNGDTSPLGRSAESELFWDESKRYVSTERAGIFDVNGQQKAQPYILLFSSVEDLTAKEVLSDDLYFELGKYPFPLPSNTIQGMSFCTLTPGETEVALSLLRVSKRRFKFDSKEHMEIEGDKTLFQSNLLEYGNYINEAHLEFTLLADIKPFQRFLEEGSYILCRQVPISPFKPFQMDRADICMYNTDKPICNGTIPNIIIELKKERANFHAYNQMVRYLRWLEKITNEEEFARITPIIIAPSFFVNRSKADLTYEGRIIMYTLGGTIYSLL